MLIYNIKKKAAFSSANNMTNDVFLFLLLHYWLSFLTLQWWTQEFHSEIEECHMQSQSQHRHHFGVKTMSFFSSYCAFWVFRQSVVHCWELLSFQRPSHTLVLSSHYISIIYWEASCSLFVLIHLEQHRHLCSQTSKHFLLNHKTFMKSQFLPSLCAMCMEINKFIIASNIKERFETAYFTAAWTLSDIAWIFNASLWWWNIHCG